MFSVKELFDRNGENKSPFLEQVPATLASEWVSIRYLPPLEMKSSMMRGLGPPGGSSGR